MILIVDDYRDSAEALCSLLTVQGYHCQWAGSGHEALALIRNHPPEQPLLVVLDEMMPEMSGVEVLKTIRSDPKISQTTVIIYSAGFDVEKRDEALTLGASAWLLKGAAGNIDASINSITHWYTKVGGVPLKNPSR